MCFTKDAQPQSQQQYKGKPKQAYQTIIPEQLNEQYECADKSDDDDDNFIIAYQMHAQPQKMLNNQKPPKVTQRNAPMLTFHIGSNSIITSVYVYNLTLVLMST